MGSWKGRGNQYIQLVKVLYCKLLTNGKQLPAFPLEVGNRTPTSEVGGECYHSPRPWPLILLLNKKIDLNYEFEVLTSEFPNMMDLTF